MTRQFSSTEFLSGLYNVEQSISSFLASLNYDFAPVFVYGDVGGSGLYNVAGVTPTTTEPASYLAGGSIVSDTYTGTTLWNLLDNTAGGVTTTGAKNDILSKYVAATGADGYQAVFSLGELDPAFGNQPDLVATSDTAKQLGPHGSDGLTRLAVPADVAGGRYVSDLLSLRVGSLPEPGPTGPGGFSPQATLSGAVADPTVITPETLGKLNQSQTETVAFTSASGPVTDTYTGVSLWNVIQDAGLLTDPSIKNDLLRYVVVATGSDGYRALFSLGEIDPAFGNQKDLVAYADTRGQLGANGSGGAMRIVVPGDQAGGRYVSNLASLEVMDVSSLRAT